MDKAPPESSFDITLEIIKETDYEIVLKACSMWTDMEQESGMAIMDVGIPSGFALDWDSVEKVSMTVTGFTTVREPVKLTNDGKQRRQKVLTDSVKQNYASQNKENIFRLHCTVHSFRESKV